ncbi:SDR family oxidoreductase [Helicobacter sp. 11S02596-1]|uniref:SDR family oxidoreductase n=1 Tax=Helicobacter sp. 11S02596-1 TaxID=1476194 RepID=UPI000BA67442|nr:SDR family oxidoreductase [Helicobacter sp. 11S02596-1]PAF45170.1 hypothetical protein BJI48_00975 [Helicobacter sp. 11S02596-1]
MKPVVLLTGGSSGIGLGIAKALAKSYQIAFIVRNVGKMGALLQTFPNPNEHKIFECDLSDIKNVENTMVTINNELKIFAFIHSAGINYVSYAKHFDYPSMLECANVNIYSAMSIVKFLLKKAQKPYLKNIIFISSISAIKGACGDGLYACTKGGIDAYMKVLCKEVAPDIQVNSILPGTIFGTDTTTKIYTEEQKQDVLKKYPLGEGRPEDIASGVMFLLQNRWVTGQQLIIDGGFCA